MFGPSSGVMFELRRKISKWANAWLALRYIGLYKVTFLNLEKVPFFQFYPTDLVNTKTTIPHRVGTDSAGYIPPLFTSPSGNSPFNTSTERAGYSILCVCF